MCNAVTVAMGKRPSTSWQQYRNSCCGTCSRGPVNATNTPLSSFLPQACTNSIIKLGNQDSGQLYQELWAPGNMNVFIVMQLRQQADGQNNRFVFTMCNNIYNYNVHCIEHPLDLDANEGSVLFSLLNRSLVL